MGTERPRRGESRRRAKIAHERQGGEQTVRLVYTRLPRDQRLYLGRWDVTNLVRRFGFMRPRPRIVHERLPLDTEAFYLHHVVIDDLAPLAALTELRDLCVTNSRFGDLSPISELTGLQVLSLSGSDIRDLAPLAELRALKMLFLTNTQVVDLTPLADLPCLEALYLDETPVVDLTPLAGLPMLEDLTLDETPVADLRPLSGLASLRALQLQGTRVKDLSPLTKLDGLSFLIDPNGRAHGDEGRLDDSEARAEIAQAIRAWEPIR